MRIRPLFLLFLLFVDSLAVLQKREHFHEGEPLQRPYLLYSKFNCKELLKISRFSLSFRAMARYHKIPEFDSQN